MADRQSLVSAILQAVQQQGASIPAAKSTVQGEMQAGAADSMAQADAIKAGGAARATEIRDTGALELQSQDYLQNFVRNLGTSATSPNESMLELADRHRASTLAAVSAAKEVDALGSVGPLDNPLQWIMNTLRLPDAQQKLRTAATESDATGAALKSLNAQSQDFAKTVHDTQKKTSAAIVDAKAQQALADADARAAQARAAAHTWRIQEVESNLAMDGRQIAALESQYRVLQTEDAWKLQQENARRANELARMQLDRMKKDEQLEEATYKEYTAGVQEVAARNGIKVTMPANAQQFQAAVKTFGPQFRKQFDDLFALHLTQRATGVDQLGASPAVAMLTRRNLGIPIASDQERKTVEFVEGVWQQLQTAKGIPDPKDPTKTMVDAAGRPYVITDGVSDQEAMQMLNSAVNQLKLSGGLKELTPSVKAVKSSFRGMDEWPLFKAISGLEAADKDALTNMSPQQLYDMGLAAYKQNKLSLTDLSKGLKDYADLALRLENQQGAYIRHGLQNTKSLLVKVGGKPVDLASAEGQIEVMRRAFKEKTLPAWAAHAQSVASDFVPGINPPTQAQREAEQRLLDAALKAQGVQ